MEKKFKHREVEVCEISQKAIDTDKDKWTVVIEYNKQKKTNIGFYKSELLEGLIKGNQKKLIKHTLKETFAKANQMMKGLMGTNTGNTVPQSFPHIDGNNPHQAF